MMGMMASLEKQQGLAAAQAAETFRVEQLALRPMSTAPEGHVLLCKTKHEADVYFAEGAAYGANAEEFGHANDGWHLLYFVDGAWERQDEHSSLFMPGCWQVYDTYIPVPANPVGWVLDLGSAK